MVLKLESGPSWGDWARRGVARRGTACYGMDMEARMMLCPLCGRVGHDSDFINESCVTCYGERMDIESQREMFDIMADEFAEMVDTSLFVSEDEENEFQDWLISGFNSNISSDTNVGS